MNRRNLLFPRIFAWSMITLFLLVYLYIGQLYVAYGPSMEPTLYSGERLLVDKKAYQAVKPAVGNVVALINPDNSSLLFIKRVVAEGGDRVEVSSEGVRVNFKLEPNTEGLWKAASYTLKEDEVFVLGDNRLQSSDSRDFGPVKLNRILGKVKMVIWPPGSFRIVR